MSVGAADLHKSIVAIWNASTLDAAFKALWDSDVIVADFIVLNDQEASPKQPWPYCVFLVSEGTTISRMSGGENRYNSYQEIHEYPCVFRISAKYISTTSAKTIATTLAEEILKVYGGHPTQSRTGDFSLDNGNFLISQYQTESGIRTDNNEYQWDITYTFKLDVPVAA